MLVVGSYHINTSEDGEQTLRMFMGEGDKYSCYDDVPLANITWNELDIWGWRSLTAAEVL